MLYLPEVSPLVVLPASLSPSSSSDPLLFLGPLTLTKTSMMEGVQLMLILLVGTSLKFGKGKGPAKKSKGSDDDDGDSDPHWEYN